MNFILTVIAVFGLFQSDSLAQNNPITMDSAKIVFVKKPFLNKMGKKTGRYEWYARRSIQDYFIKFCESTISLDEFEKRMKNLENELIKSLNVSFEIIEGNWDQCDDKDIQSRVGPYMILHTFNK